MVINMIKALRKKFVLINMLLVSVVLVIVFTAQCYTRYRQTQGENVRTLQMALDRRDDQRPRHFEIGQKPPLDFARSPMFIVRITPDGTSQLVMEENVSVSVEQLGQIAAGAMENGKAEGVLSGWSLRYMMRSEDGGTRIAFLDVSDDMSSIRNTILLSVLFCALSIAAFFVISLFLSSWVLRPVEHAWRQQKRFVADASHELKTPLTVILANIGILKSKGSSTIDEQAVWIENTEAETKRMKGLVDDLLFLAKTDDAKNTTVYDKVNLSDVFFSTALALESLAFERDVGLDTDGIAPYVNVAGDVGQLRQLVGILLDNAIKYSAENGTVTLTLARKQNKVVLTVHNGGIPITPEDLGHLFERFYRADRSRSKEGYGLGLSIAQSIVKAHKGAISVESASEKGTTFTVEIPLFV